MSIIDRLQQIIEHEDMTVSAFAKKVGVADQSIRGIVVQKRNKPGYDLIAKITQSLEWLNTDWLITGRGEMIKGSATAQDASSNNEDQLEQYENLMRYIKEKDDKIEKLIEERTRLQMTIDTLIENERMRGWGIK